MSNIKSLPSRKGCLSRLLRRLKGDQSGLALTEFAFALPILTGLGGFGLEISNLALTQMQLSQAALNLADNASRLGQTNAGAVNPVITESAVVQSFQGTDIQTSNLDLLSNGRVILSSLELDDDDNQIIRWQRCKGLLNVASAYGIEGTNGTDAAGFTGMGSDGSEVQATSGSAVMFVELEYQFTGLFGDLFIDSSILRQEAAFNIRDDRNLTAGLNNDGK